MERKSEFPALLPLCVPPSLPSQGMPVYRINPRLQVGVLSFKAVSNLHCYVAADSELFHFRYTLLVGVSPYAEGFCNSPLIMTHAYIFLCNATNSCAFSHFLSFYCTRLFWVHRGKFFSFSLAFTSISHELASRLFQLENNSALVKNIFLPFGGESLLAF